jgi:O-antigen/teichoic acid export membrane protein
MMRPIISLFVNHLLQHALGLISSILAARLLGVELRGVVVIVVAASTLGMTISQLGLPQALNFHLARSRGQRETLGAALAVCFRMIPLILLVAVVFFILAAWLGGTTLLRGLPTNLVVAAFLFAVAMTGQEVVIRLLLGLHDYSMRNVVNVLQPALTATMLAIFWLGGLTLQPWHLAIGYVVFTTISVCVGAAAIKRKHTAVVGTLPLDWKRDYVGYGLKFYPSLLVNMLNYRADAFLVNAFLGSAAVGLYATGVVMTEVLLFLPHTVNFVFFNHISRAPMEERHGLTVRTLGFSLCSVSAGAAVLAIALPFLIPTLYGQDFAPATPVAMWLLPGMAALTVVKVLTHAVAGCDKPEYATYTTVVGLVATLALDFWLIPTHGILGAAWASLAGYSVWAAATTFLYLRIVRVGPVRFTAEVLTAPIFVLFAWLRPSTSRRRHAPELVNLEAR